MPSEALEAFLKHKSVDAGELELLAILPFLVGSHAAILDIWWVLPPQG